MSTDVKQLIESIQRIAEGSPLFTEVRGLLKEIQRRGGIEGLSLKIGADDETGGDCCTDPNETGEPTVSEGADISGDAPPDMSGGTPEGWNDCETGQPITFDPAGFPQPETCKGDCEIPDPEWQKGYWYTSGGFSGASPGAVAMSRASAQYPYTVVQSATYLYEFVSLIGYKSGGIPSYGPYYYLRRMTTLETGEVSTTETFYMVTKINCATSPSEYCTDEAPTISDCQDWEPDNTTSYTLANGCITASSCDTDASEQAKQCNDCINICNEDGEERRVCSIGNGQFIMYDPSGEHKGGRYNSATGERLEILDPGSNGGYGSIE